MLDILCKTLQCCPAVYIFIALFIVIFIVLRFLGNNQLNMKAAIIFCLILSGGGTYIINKKNQDKWPKMYYAFCTKSAPPIYYIYDSDIKNDNFIKGSLQNQQLKNLDKILIKEKQKNGLRLSDADLNRISRNNNELNDAYFRWRKCRNMMRSLHHVIYPDERALYLKKQK
jgi:hypothetical protein